MTQRQLLIVAHAPSANTERLRDAVIEGARSDEYPNVTVAALSPFDATSSPGSMTVSPMAGAFNSTARTTTWPG